MSRWLVTVAVACFVAASAPAAEAQVFKPRNGQPAKGTPKTAANDKAADKPAAKPADKPADKPKVAAADRPAAKKKPAAAKKKKHKKADDEDDDTVTVEDDDVKVSDD